MKSKPYLLFVILLFTLLGFSGGYALAQSGRSPLFLFGTNASIPANAQDTFKPFWEVWNQVHARYVEQPLNDEALMEGAINGMLAVLDDPYTRYLSPEEEQMARQDMRGELQGIGAQVEEVEGAITIVSPLEGSPASEAGLQPGDILREADGIPLTGLPLSEAVRIVRGPAGTAVHLKVERDGQVFEIEIDRGIVQRDSVVSNMLPENIAYIQLRQFGDTTAVELEKGLTELLDQNPVGLVLDLRRNPGGGLSTVVDVANQFLDDGVISTEQFGDGRQNVFLAKDDGLAQDIPLVVLIDEGSASASELLAGAIRDRNRGVLIGETSFGKGTVQAWPHLSNGGGLRLTIARWLTPDDDWIHEKGIDPTYFVAKDANNLAEDAQLQAAIDFLLGRPVTGARPAPEG